MGASGAGVARARPLVKPLAAALLAVGLLVASSACLVGSSTSDNISLLSRVAAFSLPVMLGLVPLVIVSALVRRAAWDQRPLRVALTIYVVLLGAAGLALAASSFGVVGPPPMR